MSAQGSRERLRGLLCRSERAGRGLTCEEAALGLPRAKPIAKRRIDKGGRTVRRRHARLPSPARSSGKLD